MSESAPPTLLFHGDQDPNVPIEQSERMVAALSRVGVSAKLIVKKGEGHGWTDTPEDVAKVVEFLEKALKKP